MVTTPVPELAQLIMGKIKDLENEGKIPASTAGTMGVWLDILLQSGSQALYRASRTGLIAHNDVVNNFTESMENREGDTYHHDGTPDPVLPEHKRRCVGSILEASIPAAKLDEAMPGTDIPGSTPSTSSAT